MDILILYYKVAAVGRLESFLLGCVGETMWAVIVSGESSNSKSTFSACLITLLNADN